VLVENGSRFIDIGGIGRVFTLGNILFYFRKQTMVSALGALNLPLGIPS